ncbi:MAG: hypothetical protein ABSH44_13615 [Bryobacteraceae bacterium]
MKKIVFLTTSLLVLPALAGDCEQRTEEFKTWTRRSLEAVTRELAQPKAEPTVREVANAALATLALGGDPRRAEELLRTAFSYQDMDPKAPQFGTIPWQAGHPEIHDPNSIEFCMQPVGPILQGYGKLLSPGFKQAFEPHVRAAFQAMRQHRVLVTYTNIYLMKTVNFILAGEAIGDAEAAQEGYTMLDGWIDHTRDAGIGEFDSPGYYAVDLNSLLMGRLYAARPEARGKFSRVLDLVWSDLAGNFFSGRGTLSGPHSRDSDFVGGHDSVELYLYQEGLQSSRHPQGASLGRIYLLVNELAGGYHPAPDILRLASAPERIVVSRWRAEPYHDRYNYVTPDFSIGSACYHYGPQDKLIDIELASRGPELPAISVVPDTTDQPYGRIKVPDHSGHTKAVHLPLNAVSVQDKGALLVLLDLDSSSKAETGSLATNVLLPATADRIVLDGRTVSGSAPFEMAASFGSVVGVRSGRAGLAVRIASADGAGGQAAGVVLKADPEGLQAGVMRLVAYHYRGAPKELQDTHIQVAILFLAGRCETDSDFASLVQTVRSARLDRTESAAEWKVAATLGGVRLEGARDRTTRAPVYRRVNGSAMPGAALAINGRDIMQALFGTR